MKQLEHYSPTNCFSNSTEHARNKGEYYTYYRTKLYGARVQTLTINFISRLKGPLSTAAKQKLLKACARGHQVLPNNDRARCLQDCKVCAVFLFSFYHEQFYFLGCLLSKAVNF